MHTAQLPDAPEIEFPPSGADTSDEMLTQGISKLAVIITFLAGDGLVLLRRQAVLTYAEWDTLFNHIYQVWNALGESRYVTDFFCATMERGINDVARLLPTTDDVGEFVGEFNSQELGLSGWIDCLEYNLCKERIPAAEKRRELITLFMEKVAVPLIQRSRSQCGTELVRIMAPQRFPSDRQGQDMFKKHWMARIG